VLSIYQHAATFEDARSVGSRISTSALVKTALYGEDAKCEPSVFSVSLADIALHTAGVGFWRQLALSRY
jgi:N-acetylglutamate synthase/N-acetylornithine aminotransferase